MKERIAEQLAALGIERGDTVLVHSSMKSLGHVEGGPDTVIDALLECLGEEGTLMFPTLSFLSVPRDRPRFDLLNTQSDVGLISETFRRLPEARRSLHPTHSCTAVGPKAGFLLDDHGKDRTPCGPNSPFAKLPKIGGKLLMLGCGLNPNTSMHAVEETVEPDYLYGPDVTYQLTDAKGVCHTVRYRTHGFSGWDQAYERVEALLSPSACRVGKVLQATAHLVDTVELWRVAAAQLRLDPHAFVAPANEPH